MPKVPYTPYPTQTGAEIAAPRVDIAPAGSPAYFGAMIGQGEEKLGQGFDAVGTAAATIQNLKDEVNVNQAVTKNFQTIDMMNGDFEKRSGDVQAATLPYHIDNMRKQVEEDSAGMSVNQKLLFDRQTLWNLRAQIARATSSANSSLHAFSRDQVIGDVNNTVDHAIRNIDNDATFHLDMEHISEQYTKLATMDHTPSAMMEYNLKKTFDAIGHKMILSVINGPKQDVVRAGQILTTMTPQMTPATVIQLDNLIKEKKNDIDAHRIARDTATEVVPPIGGDHTTGVVTEPNTAPTEPVVPIPSVQPPKPPGPEIRSEISPAQDAINRGDYLAYARETYRPHAPVEQVSLPSEITRGVSMPSQDVSSAISDAAKATNLDPRTLTAIASVESDNHPGSNRNRATQYKGLFQIGKEEWRRYGEGDIYDAHDNAMAAARMLADHRQWFMERYGRAPTDAELYMMHQQGRGFYSRGTMTNISGNRYPGMRGPQSRASFQEGWGRELDRRKGITAQFVGA
jgi:hypothetical protein